MKGSIWDAPFIVFVSVFLVIFGFVILSIVISFSSIYLPTSENTFYAVSNVLKHPLAKENLIWYIWLTFNKADGMTISFLNTFGDCLVVAITMLICAAMYLASNLKFDLKTIILFVVFFVFTNFLAILFDLFFAKFLQYSLISQYIPLMTGVLEFIRTPSMFLFFVSVLVLFAMIVKSPFKIQRDLFR